MSYIKYGIKNLRVMLKISSGKKTFILERGKSDLSTSIGIQYNAKRFKLLHGPYF